MSDPKVPQRPEGPVSWSSGSGAPSSTESNTGSATTSSAFASTASTSHESSREAATSAARSAQRTDTPGMEGWVLEVAPRQEAPVASPPPRRLLPLLLFVATCASTLLTAGPLYAVAVMSILTCHELGHYLQARRYGVPASLPYFIPMPISPLGTMGAMIVMRERISSTRALFDIGITGPLAGLPPTLLFCILGLRLSEVREVTGEEPYWELGSPLLFDWLSLWLLGPTPEGYDIFLHPLAFAGWVGLFITALNLLPVGQLDGGHILYALLKDKAHTVARLMMVAAIAGVVWGGHWGWSLLIFLLLVMGLRHPPTLDGLELGPGRKLLGWLTLAFFVLGFTPIPLTPPGM